MLCAGLFRAAFSVRQFESLLSLSSGSQGVGPSRSLCRECSDLAISFRWLPPFSLSREPPTALGLDCVCLCLSSCCLLSSVGLQACLATLSSDGLLPLLPPFLRGLHSTHTERAPPKAPRSLLFCSSSGFTFADGRVFLSRSICVRSAVKSCSEFSTPAPSLVLFFKYVISVSGGPSSFADAVYFPVIL